MDDPLTYHLRFSPDEFDAQYNLRAARPDHEQTVIPGWVADSETARADLDCTLDVRYGAGTKQLLDVFRCGDATAPTLVYVHGGYWQRGDKSVYSFLARPFVAHGINIVVIGYDLCPTVTITEISQEAREAVAYVWHNADHLGISGDRLTGDGPLGRRTHHTDDDGHRLARVGSGAAAGSGEVRYSGVAAELPRTGAFDRGPQWRHSHGPRRGRGREPYDESPAGHRRPAARGRRGAETDEFHRQAQMYVDKYASDRRAVEMYVVPGVDHFDELNVLVDQASEFFAKTCAIVKAPVAK